MAKSPDPKLQASMKAPPVEAMVYLAVACLAIWFFVLISSQVGKPVTLFGAAPEGLDPRSMPRLVLLGIAVVGVRGAITSFRKETIAFTRPTPMVGITCLASFFFAAVLVPLGFVLASAMTVLSLSIILGGRHLIGLALAGLLVPAGIYVIFTRVLHIALPPGLLGV